MKLIKKYVNIIDDELSSATEYAENYIEAKANGKDRGDDSEASMWKRMAEQELQHAINIHSAAVTEIEKINAVFTAPAEMYEKWEMSHNDYIKRTAWIKQMLSM